MLTVDFELDGQQFTAINGGPEFTFDEAVSLLINCADQDEVDYYWEKLTDGGEESQCGWLKDRYGLSWQVVPAGWDELLKRPRHRRGQAGHEGHARDEEDRHRRPPGRRRRRPDATLGAPRRRVGRPTCDNPPVDLTAVATPGYFASMGIENALLKKRAERIGPTAADYERGDTLANLTMGTASLFIPMATHALFDRIAPQRSKTGKGLVAVAATAAVATTVADRIIRNRAARRRSPSTDPANGPVTTDRLATSPRADDRGLPVHRPPATNGHGPSTNGHAAGAGSEAPDPVLERARLVARFGGPTAIVAGGLAIDQRHRLRHQAQGACGSAAGRRGTSAPGSWRSLAAIAGWDFIYYWNHRFDARGPLPVGASTSSTTRSERYNLSTALRQPVADVLGVFVPYGAAGLGRHPPGAHRARPAASTCSTSTGSTPT